MLPDACALAIFGCEPTIVVTSDGILSAKYLGGGRRKNVPFKPVGGKKKKDEPKKPEPSPLLLGLLARGLALPPVEELPASIVTPQLPEIVLAPLAFGGARAARQQACHRTRAIGVHARALQEAAAHVRAFERVER